MIERPCPVRPGLLLLGLLPACAGSPAIAAFRDAHDEFLERAVADPLVRLEGRLLPDGKVHGDPGELELAEAWLDAIVPIPVERDTFLVTGALLGARSYDFDGAPTADDTLHRYAVRLGAGTFVNDDLVVQAFWQPSIYSDLDGALQSEDYRFDYGTALAVWRSTPGLFWKGGFTATDAVDTGVLPLAGVTWHFAAGWRLDVLLPRNAGVTFAASPRWRLSGGLRVESDEYHVREPTPAGSASRYVHVQELVGYVGAEHLFSEHLSAWLQLGTTIAGNYDWSDGTSRPDLDGTLEPGAVLLAGVGWRF